MIEQLTTAAEFAAAARKYLDAKATMDSDSYAQSDEAVNRHCKAFHFARNKLWRLLIANETRAVILPDGCTIAIVEDDQAPGDFSLTVILPNDVLRFEECGVSASLPGSPE